MIKPAKLELDGQVYELPTLRGTEGEPAVSILVDAQPLNTDMAASTAAAR